MEMMFTNFDYQSLISEEKKVRQRLSDIAEKAKSSVEINPKKRTIRNIFNFASALDVKKSRLIKHIEYIAN